MKGSKRGCCILLDSTDHMKMNMLMDKVTASVGFHPKMNTTPLPVGKYHETSDHNEEDSLKIFAARVLLHCVPVSGLDLMIFGL